jgi:outer membrane protein TolC
MTKRLIVSTLLLSLMLLIPGEASSGLFAGNDEKLTLQETIRIALEQNEIARKTDAAWEASQARLARARAVFFPQISFTGLYNRRPDSVERTIGDQTVTIQSLNALSGTANLSMILFDPRSFPLYSQVRNQNRADEAVYHESRRLLSFEVAAIYLATFSVDQVQEAAAHRLEFADRNLEAARVRFHAGLVSKNDVTRGELELANAQREVIRSGGDVRHTYLTLSSLLCIPIEKKLTLPQEILQAAEASPGKMGDMVATALDYRQDINALRWQARALQAASKEPLMRWLPSLSLNGQVRITNEAGLQGKNTTWALGAALNWTLFDGFARNADHREKKAQARMAALDVAAAERKVDLAIQDALSALAVSQAALHQARLAESIARQNADETSELYRQGLTSALVVADANLRMFEAEVSRVREYHGLALALLNLRSVLGLDPFGDKPDMSRD